MKVDFESSLEGYLRHLSIMIHRLPTVAMRQSSTKLYSSLKKVALIMSPTSIHN